MQCKRRSNPQIKTDFEEQNVLFSLCSEEDAEEAQETYEGVFFYLLLTTSLIFSLTAMCFP